MVCKISLCVLGGADTPNNGQISKDSLLSSLNHLFSLSFGAFFDLPNATSLVGCPIPYISPFRRIWLIHTTGGSNTVGSWGLCRVQHLLEGPCTRPHIGFGVAEQPCSLAAPGNWISA